MELKTPKGTTDVVGRVAHRKAEILATIRRVFEDVGGVELDTPVFERRDALAGKYGEEGARLIYDLADQGGELCSLRYDLTVPFARWLAMNPTVRQIQRFQIGKVYRRDQPALARGRLREFWQCDFDIAGRAHDRMMSDAKILGILVRVLSRLGLAGLADNRNSVIVIKLNHRRILDGIFAVAGVPEPLLRPISAAVDKLDKLPWADVRREMLGKGLSADVADRLGHYVQQAGTLQEMLPILQGSSSSSGADDDDSAVLASNNDIQAGVEDMLLLQEYLEAWDIDASAFTLDLSLARGLDYYTGLICEAVMRDDVRDSKKRNLFDSKISISPPLQIGSIAGGGRYDGLVGMYGKEAIPCVGLSIGVDRVFALLQARQSLMVNAIAKPLAPVLDVYVMSADKRDGLLRERARLTARLWDADIRAHYTLKAKPRLDGEMTASKDVPIVVVLHGSELSEGKVQVKQAITGRHGGSFSGVFTTKIVSLDKVVEEIKTMLANSL
ncbi:histidyl-tRNA mitochondrial precursor [Grosmannia clavigera kw1407]|uniref:histidine--tRNA ligase n=1 Tax=Grosmannia clavigera (strain kw1407 / UAMH 11150) TaxID=655863 RepID=F0XS27_GROCL|nr:histidyl-tRNA mitochondrial precursor [Grosmannia clavigera kw1407]EFW99420.1 histidyl-tRNA mitochondrial precursor [Grosmannia clavigera kw1407]